MLDAAKNIFVFLNLQRKKIVLLTKIWNNNGPRQDDKLSIVFITDADQVFGYGINNGGCLGIGFMPTSINMFANRNQLYNLIHNRFVN
ncbi:hypothetical protein BLOT_002328 [Blomia tropicalis]|nr:hypothetical protein BLOT_002328 [Blomia tropicalis]